VTTGAVDGPDALSNVSAQEAALAIAAQVGIDLQRLQEAER
jgi:hypothetical protein